MTRIIVIDQESCILAGECIYNHPDHFAWNDDATAVLATKAEIETADDESEALHAISMCPSRAISILDA